MKLKKLAAKISSLTLMALCCSFVKTSAYGPLPRTSLLGSIDQHKLGTEIYIYDVDTSSLSKKDKNFENIINTHFFNLREMHSNVFKVTYDGIVYEVNPETKTLSIIDLNSPTGKICKGAIDLLNISYKARETYEKVYDPYGRPYNLVSGYQISKPFIINKVIMQGNIRKIPEDLFTSGYMSTCRVDDRFRTNDLPDSIFTGIPVEELDLSQITSEKLTIDRWGFLHCMSVKKIILPSCPVEVVKEYFSDPQELHETAEIVNKEFITYKELDSISCCTVA